MVVLNFIKILMSDLLISTYPWLLRFVCLEIKGKRKELCKALLVNVPLPAERSELIGT